jgi:3-hydroxy-5-methyl-1-naphthoate 3-O-methyltransferase
LPGRSACSPATIEAMNSAETTMWSSSAEMNRQLIARAHRALKQGGRLVIGDLLPNEERTGPPFPVMFAINMFLHCDGDTYTFAEYRAWLREAGFGDVSAYDTKRSHSPVIIAKR